jgi:UDP-2,3-diacylglucosamine hydrolase
MPKKTSYTLFISDLHLNPDQPKQHHAFCDLLQQHQTQADALYILGDWFNVWYGDDHHPDWLTPITEALKHASKTLPIYVMKGNRDVLIGESFCNRSGCTLIQDPTCIQLYQHSFLLTHGDYLCINDTSHQLMRRIFDRPLLQKAFVKLPLPLRLNLGNRIRKHSKNKRKKNQNPTKFDLCPHTVNQWLEQHQAQCLIHGHTHKPALLPLDNQNNRITLGSWDQHCFTLTINQKLHATLNYLDLTSQKTHRFAQQTLVPPEKPQTT